jgi:hypothetical protein
LRLRHTRQRTHSDGKKHTHFAKHAYMLTRRDNES